VGGIVKFEYFLILRYDSITLKSPEKPFIVAVEMSTTTTTTAVSTGNRYPSEVD
jgi:hypothetical protein